MNANEVKEAMDCGVSNANEVKEAMDCGVSISEIQIDLKASLMKPLNANWIISAITTLSECTESIRKPFETVGILYTCM